MQRASSRKQPVLVAAFLLAAVLLWATEPSAAFVPTSRSTVAQVSRTQVKAAADSAPNPPVPVWFPFADVLNGWLQDAFDAVMPTEHSMSLEEFEKMNDELASMRTRLQAARDREQRALKAMEELEREMEQESLDVEDGHVYRVCGCAPVHGSELGRL